MPARYILFNDVKTSVFEILLYDLKELMSKYDYKGHKYMKELFYK
ncbi:MAG: hypothetical protein BWY74_02673 [Firmicutes bacterium ADurb.Bin419]|nr:MAG: hypothetical protein BWY74_02673 [Firmicutes bacterium ADurb.Bin419]